MWERPAVRPPSAIRRCRHRGRVACLVVIVRKWTPRRTSRVAAALVLCSLWANAMSGPVPILLSQCCPSDVRAPTSVPSSQVTSAVPCWMPTSIAANTSASHRRPGLSECSLASGVVGERVPWPQTGEWLPDGRVALHVGHIWTDLHAHDDIGEVVWQSRGDRHSRALTRVQCLAALELARSDQHDQRLTEQERSAARRIERKLRRCLRALDGA